VCRISQNLRDAANTISFVINIIDKYVNMYQLKLQTTEENAMIVIVRMI
jgi:hypothetical protein